MLPTTLFALRRWLERRRATRELTALDDRELADIGLVRVRFAEIDVAIVQQYWS